MKILNKNEQFIDACKNNNVELIKQLLEEEKIDVNYQYEYGWTAFIWACHLNNVETIKELLKHPDININIQTNFGYTALIRACYWNNVQPVKELLKRSEINLELKSEYGKSAYDLAKGNDNKKIMLLLKIKKLQQTIYNSNEKI